MPRPAESPPRRPSSTKEAASERACAPCRVPSAGLGAGGAGREGDEDEGEDKGEDEDEARRSGAAARRAIERRRSIYVAERGPKAAPKVA
jgi:hypothetical protein